MKIDEQFNWDLKLNYKLGKLNGRACCMQLGVRNP